MGYMTEKRLATPAEQEYVFRCLFDLFRAVLNEAKCELDVNDIRQSAAGLGTRMFRQICTVEHLMKGSPIPYGDGTQGNWDFSSIDCVARSVIETYLIFHWIFIAPGSSEEKEFKYLAWIMGSLIDRKKNYSMDIYHGLAEIKEAKAELPDVPTILDNDKREIEKMKGMMKTNRFFIEEVPKMTDPDQRARYTKMPEKGWYPGGWKHLQESVPSLHRLKAHQVMSHAVHACFLHIRQLTHARDADSQQLLSGFGRSVLQIIMSRMCFEYIQVFPHAEKAFEKYPTETVIARTEYEAS